MDALYPCDSPGEANICAARYIRTPNLQVLVDAGRVQGGYSLPRLMAKRANGCRGVSIFMDKRANGCRGVPIFMTKRANGAVRLRGGTPYHQRCLPQAAAELDAAVSLCARCCRRGGARPTPSHSPSHPAQAQAPPHAADKGVPDPPPRTTPPTLLKQQLHYMLQP